MGLPFKDRPARVTRLALPAQVDAIAEAVESALAISPPMRAGDGTEQGTDAMRLALTEALNNVLEHGGHDAREPIHLHVGTSGQAYWICVEDAGHQIPAALLFEPAETPEPDYASMPLDALPEGGWGWMLIRASVERLEYARRDDRNYLLLAAGAPVGIGAVGIAG